MREFETTFDKALVGGLRPEERIPINSQALIECYNFRCGKYGLESYTDLTHPFGRSFSTKYTWPYPTILEGSSHILMYVRDTANKKDTVYSINKTTDVLTSVYDFTQAVYGTPAYPSLADFGEAALLVNGRGYLYYNPATDAWVAGKYTAAIPTMRTVCAHGGRLVGGGISSSWYGCEDSYVVWSQIGAMDFRITEKNTAGYARPGIGSIRTVKTLAEEKGSGVVLVYGSGGVSLLYPISAPAPGYGYNKLLSVGVLSSKTVDGDEKTHVFVGADGNLWRITNKKVDSLGYKEYLSTLVPGNVVVRYNSVDEEAYISDGERAFLLSNYGLTEIPQMVTGTWFDQGSWGIAKPIARQSYKVVSHPFDMQLRGQKTIVGVEAGISGATGAYMAVDWRIDKSAEFRRTGWVQLNNQGFATLTIAGVEFRLCLMCEEGEEVKVDWMKCRWKTTDLRNIRGVYAAPPRGQSYAD